MKRIFIALLSLTFLSFTRAEDWPQWRGARRDGISTEKDLLASWPAGGPHLAWQTNGLGAGYSSISVVGDRIYTAGDRGGASFVHALSTDGKPIWSAKLGQQGEHGGYHGPRGQPTVDGDAIYVLGQFGELVCYSAADGKEVWRKNLSKDFDGAKGDWGYSESVLIDGDQLICTPGGTKGAVLALNKKSGSPLWRTTGFTDGAQYVSPVIATIGGVKQYVQMTMKSVVGVSTDGKVLWRADRKGSTAVIPTAVVRDDLVYVTSGYGVGCNLFKITKQGETFTAKQVYANKTMVNHHGGVVLVGDHLYGYSDGKGWTCQKFATGEMVWSDKKLGKGSVIYADGRLYLRSESGRGTVALLEASPAGYNEVGRFDQPDRSKQNSWPHPVISNGRLYLRDQDILLCYDLKSR